jgi:hypothetical protein
MHSRTAAQYLLAARGEHGFECFDAIVRRFEEEILHDGLGTLELRDQHFRVRSARHFAAHLRYDAVAAGAMQNDEDAPFSRLHEVGGLRNRMLRDSSRSAPFPSCHSFGRLPERRFKEYTLFTVSRSPEPPDCDIRSPGTGF